MRHRLLFPPTSSFLLALFAGGVPFSLALAYLGIDIESPQLVRYALFASPMLGIFLVLIVVCWADASFKRIVVQTMWCSVAMWVPFEVLTYVGTSWGLRRWTVFSWYNLPFLLLLLTGWSIVIALSSTAIAMIIRKMTAFGRNPR